MKTVLLCLRDPMQTLGKVWRILKRLCKPSTFGLERTQHFSSSADLLLMFASGYINTAKQVLSVMLYYW